MYHQRDLRIAFLAALLAAPMALVACRPPAVDPGGLPPAPTPVTSQPVDVFGDQAAFEAALRDAIIARDFEALAQLMRDIPLTVGLWQSEGYQKPSPIEAASDIVTHIPEGGTVTFVADADLTALLGGTDPLSMWGPNVTPVSALLSQGWEDGNGEAILIVAQHPQGGFYWHAALLAPFGFAPGSGVGGTPVGTEGGGTLQDFEAALMDAVTDHNYSVLQYMVGDPFTVAAFQSEGNQVSAVEFAAQLQQTHLGANATPVFVADADLTALLGGTDPLTLWDPAVKVVDALYSQGWGPQGTDQVLLIIAENTLADGTSYWYWYALLYLPPQQGDNTTFRAQFENELIRAVVERDFAAMKALMRDSFEIGGWQAEGAVYTPDEAITKLQVEFYPPAEDIVTFGVSQDIAALLGQNPADFFGGGVSFLHSVGWGPEGNGDAILVIDATPEGVLYWKAILFALQGF